MEINTYGDAVLLTLGFLFIGAVIVLLFVVVVQLFTGGRGLLYNYIQEYGPDHAYTLGALKQVTDKILKNENIDCTNLSIGHEVGNRYIGDFIDKKQGYRHDITIITDGWHVDYRIDNEPTKRYKP